MKHIRELASKWQIRFHDATRQPKEISYTFDKDSFTRRQIQSWRDELRYLWQKGEWDPWSGLLPDQEDGPPRWIFKTTGDGEGERPMAHETQQMYRRQLRTFVSWLHEEGLIAEPLPRMFVSRRKIPNYVTEDELEAICEAHRQLCTEKTKKRHAPQSGPKSSLARLWMADAFRFAFYQGLRRGELLALRVGGIDLERKQIVVGDDTFIPKGKDERIITVTPPARAVIAPYLEGKHPSELVFGFRSPRRLTKCFKAAVRRADGEESMPARELARKPELSLHDLHVSCCVYWVEKGVPLTDIKDLLRHKSIQTTERWYRTTIVTGQTERFEKAFKG